MVHMSASLVEGQDTLSTTFANYYETIGPNATPSSSPRHRNVFLLTAILVLANLATVLCTNSKKGISGHPIDHISVIQLLPAFTPWKQRLQVKADHQGVSLDKELFEGRKAMLNQAEVRQEIRARLLRAQYAVGATQDAILMAQAAEGKARAAGAKAKVAAKQSQSVAEFVVKKILKGGQEAGLENAVAAAESKVTEAILGAMAATAEAKHAAKIAEEAMTKAEEVSNEAKALQATAQEAADVLTGVIETSRALRAQIYSAEIKAGQATMVLEGMHVVKEGMDAKTPEEVETVADKAATKLDQLTEMTVAAAQAVEEAMELAKEAAEADVMVTMEAKDAAVDANDVSEMAERAAIEALEATVEAAQAVIKASDIKKDGAEHFKKIAKAE